MKILHINTTDIEGGAARAAYRLHRALLENGVDSNMLVQSKKSDDYTVKTVFKSKIGKFIGALRPFLDVLPLKIFYKKRTKTPFSPAWVPFSKVADRINELDPDIVHLHWVAGGMLRIEDLAKIKKTIVWTLHDMWAFTGGEHIDEGQRHYIANCGNSKVLNSGKEKDLSRKGWERKKKTYQKTQNLVIVSPSKWMYDEARKSSLLRSKKHIHMPNVLDTKVFKPINKQIARSLWNIPKDKKIIIFGAISATNDLNKGYDLLKEAIKRLQTENVEIVIFGSSTPKKEEQLNYKITYVGRLYDDISLVTLYSCADVMIVPSKQENLPQTVTEAMACGVPVVAFNTTGIPTIIDHKIDGYLASPFDSEDLKNGIEWVLNNESYEQLSKNAREKIERHFSNEVLISKYISLYKKCLNEK
ncbi:Glycosyltransferase, group 1 family protein [Capnocytophaga canis]|uniref:Glycosyltransferase, group 1 family protein n=1 Tax=Capnocytophaga canis TaxID=1848903 RepID=A0A0B7I0P5_9FLAO|nr:glycosyltransferase family 4 protein [Capnocytophaga canis]CEN43423.1 Glycosyltransferase, group 1 family protein [Capnocytophaga canis]CEN44384.1 Glycosyltransferase, group 1 family protein [Capnocytophaga canis]